ncbi:MAG: mismatch-specific DNA-glycosylase [Nitrospinae bacterium]|nr:mismatch-specific DNA-glycosylase [Nitrospinota bacterium]
MEIKNVCKARSAKGIKVMNCTEDILPDVLEKGLKVIFVGVAVGKKSAEKKSYYADKRNKLWDVLKEFFLNNIESDTDLREINCDGQSKILLKNGIGLTDLIKNRFGGDNKVGILSKEDRKCFIDKIREYKPKVVAFNGKKAAKLFYAKKNTKNINYGEQEPQKPICETKIKFFVLPSTSGAARRLNENYCYWEELAKEISI